MSALNYEPMSDDDVPPTYQDAVNMIIGKTTNLKPVVHSAWREGRYDVVVQVLENLKQHSKVGTHDTVAACFENAFNRYVCLFKADIDSLHKEATACFNSKEFAKLEPLFVLYAQIQKSFETIPELLPSSTNEILERLKVSVSQQVQDFYAKCQSRAPEIEEVGRVMLELKKITSTISNVELAAHVHKEMNMLLNALVEKKGFDFYQLGTYLGTRGVLGREIVEGDNFPQFKALVIAKINEVTARITPHDALDAFVKLNDLSEENRKLLDIAYQKYSTRFETHLSKYLLLSTSDLDELVNQVSDSFAANRRSNWNDIREHIPVMLAGILAVWSISNSKSFYQQTKNKNSVLRPHPVQVFSLLRILEVDAVTSWTSKARVFFMGDKLKGHLIQIGTGEGKSIILGALSTILALLGFRVSCACYSQYLSARDYNSFKDLFLRFSVDSFIEYSTLADLAGGFINEQGDIRALTKDFIENKSNSSRYTRSSNSSNSSNINNNSSYNNRERILLIDEVDVFFSRDFYGPTYNPSTRLQHATISSIMEYIWKNRSTVTVSQLKGLPEYKELTKMYPRISRIIDNSIVRMIDESKKINEPEYHKVKNELGQVVIGYKENGTISTKIAHGYRTAFAYLNERDRGFIAKDTAERFMGLQVNCGQFSYAEIPKSNGCILGVTGTLKTLGKFETNVKNEEYQITKSTYTPSIYGISQLVFRENDHVFVEPSTVLHSRKILDNIIEKKNYGQAVLVFLETEEKMAEFSKGYGKDLPDVGEIKESTENIDFFVKKAIITGRVISVLHMCCLFADKEIPSLT